MERVGDLEIEQDLPHQNRMWRLRRIFWILGTTALLAGLLGLLGSGPLSKADTKSGALEVEYERFLRYQAASTLRVTVQGLSAEAPTLRLKLRRKYLEAFVVEEVHPQPLATEAGNRDHVFEFKLAEPGNPTSISFQLNPQRIGFREAEVALEGQPSVSFRQLIYP